ncbi:MAG: 3-phosphoserine/phosphohydroxythreonine transaminase [Phascolarctobacterium sp.]|uniref:3-phosphoserine/phosphohydroxythreonine transaminase n=1 Tax=Phascolarctobacterium sp. TaxID=2049039 RepID=UPI0026DAA11D|nr:3-phosphoserine/phosphohydroxythreonine transaminase [Phascolarctobacterium sp.]MDO4920875.1 3-phosphoserine/phosphohydroxythreonine transaminase [Phascolarctobacterium sp.]
MQRAYNFNAGPSAMPLEVLQEAQAEFLNYAGTGMSVIEMSHRSAEYAALHAETKALLRELMQIPDDYEIMFIQGGGSTQFLMTAANFHTQKYAAYVNTGVWAKKAMAEGKFFGEVYEAASSADKNHSYIPDSFNIKDGTSYVHLTANNTIYGTEYKSFPKFDVPVICDMSSDILSRKVDVKNFDLIYAGAQKNLGPAGVVIVIAKKAFLATARQELPTMLKYATFAANDSLYNTPPVFAIYMVNKTLHWIKEQGGVDAIAQNNAAKAKLIYDVIDGSGGFYKGHAVKEARSLMNITFNLATPELEKDFVAQGKAAGFVGIGGHRLVGGCRASAYNAVPLEACAALADFMKKYQREHE